MNTKNIFISIVVLFILALVVLALGGLQRQEQAQQGFDAEQTLKPAPPPAGVPASTAYNLSGTLLSVRGDLLTFAANMGQTAEGLQLVKEKVVKITSATQIVRFETVTNPETGKASVEERPITLAYLRPGDRIQVISNSDILTQAEIQATKIRFLGRN